MSNLTYYERQRIEFYLKLNQKVNQIARLIHRDHSVVSREIRRHKPQFSPYRADLAQKAADRDLGHGRTKKLIKSRLLRNYVVAKLKEKHSPEQIAGRLKKYPPPEIRGERISHESIYQYIYNDEDEPEVLYQHLRRAQPKRQKRYSRKPQKIKILERVSIHDREDEINFKERFGDWESDTMEFTKRKAVSVQYERKAMLTRFHRLQNKKAEETKRALAQTLEQVPEDFRKSITFDNGTEGADHTEIRDEFEVQTFFCDPYSAWQKGGVENIIGLMRQYLPRNTKLDEVTDEQMYEIQESLNNRPRKSLNFLTPNEIFQNALKIESGAFVS